MSYVVCVSGPSRKGVCNCSGSEQDWTGITWPRKLDPAEESHGELLTTPFLCFSWVDSVTISPLTVYFPETFHISWLKSLTCVLWMTCVIIFWILILCISFLLLTLDLIGSSLFSSLRCVSIFSCVGHRHVSSCLTQASLMFCVWTLPTLSHLLGILRASDSSLLSRGQMDRNLEGGEEAGY